MNPRSSVDNGKQCQNQGFDNALTQGGGGSGFWSGGIRHSGGVTIAQALVRNLGTYRFDVKGDAPVANPQALEYRCEAQGRRHVSS